jgi:hypothetical protein
LRRAADEKPLLAICIGMQALMDQQRGERRHCRCLGILPGRVRHFGQALRTHRASTLKVPHMGWNGVRQAAHPLWRGIPQDTRFYFVHSYYVEAGAARDGRRRLRIRSGFRGGAGARQPVRGAVPSGKKSYRGPATAREFRRLGRAHQGVRMLIIPAIDLKDGKCVRLRQGRMDDSTVFGDDPVAMAARWVR